MEMEMHRVSENQQAAFKMEVPELRRRLKTVRRARHRHYQGYQSHTRWSDLTALETENEQCRVRLKHWHKILMVEGTSTIRSPVRLWDVWIGLKMLADSNAVSLDDRKQYELERG
jgi:hypothetical protein